VVLEADLVTGEEALQFGQKAESGVFGSQHLGFVDGHLRDWAPIHSGARHLPSSGELDER
jgi:hypothetical protein